MVRPRLKLALLAGGVLLAHLVALEWVARAADRISGLPEMAPPMFTRLLRPAPPPPVVAATRPAPAAQPRPRVAPPPRPKASEPQPAPPAPTGSAPPESPELAAAPAAAPAASQPLAAASEPASPASAAPTAALDTWPTDTRLTYRLTGEWRSGPLFGDARVQWQREAQKYQVRLDVKIRLFGTQTFTSQGEVTPEALLPHAYEEMRPGKRRMALFGERAVTLDNGRTVPRPPGVQDTASQFVELSHRFATGREALEVGRSVQVWLGRPGGVDLWTYDIVERVVLHLPTLGDVEAFHLKPRPIANIRGNITAQMWFAPGLQYLPARIQVLMGNEAYLDLLVDHIEQR